MLNALDIPELITHDENEYEQLAYQIATDKNKLKSIKNKIAKNILNKPLFNTKGYVMNLEKGFKSVYSLFLKGKKPETVYLNNKT